MEPFKRRALTLKEVIGSIVPGILDGRSNAYDETMDSLLQQTKTTARGFRNIENFIAMPHLRAAELTRLPQNPLPLTIARDYGRYCHVFEKSISIVNGIEPLARGEHGIVSPPQESQ